MFILLSNSLWSIRKIIKGKNHLTSNVSQNVLKRIEEVFVYDVELLKEEKKMQKIVVLRKKENKK